MNPPFQNKQTHTQKKTECLRELWKDFFLFSLSSLFQSKLISMIFHESLHPHECCTTLLHHVSHHFPNHFNLQRVLHHVPYNVTRSGLQQKQLCVSTFLVPETLSSLCSDGLYTLIQLYSSVKPSVLKPLAGGHIYIPPPKKIMFYITISLKRSKLIPIYPCSIKDHYPP